jgi:endonuclease YncB( thermonuclease family)
MAFKAIKGTFHVVGFAPDGDSIKFKADNEANWATLEGKKVALTSKTKYVQLRIEAIDTLETHYGVQHQPPQFAHRATERLLALLGITEVIWNAAHTKVTSAKDGTEGYIVSRTTDKYGRPIAFVFGADPAIQDGQEIFIDAKMVKKSVNYQLLKEGLAYPTFYDGLFYDLREVFATQSRKARKKEKGLWPADTTNAFFQVGGLADVTDKNVILPKLFRRIVTFLAQANGVFDAQQFLAYLKKDSESVLILSKLHFTHLDNLLEVDPGGKIRLTELPEDLVFLA